MILVVENVEKSTNYENLFESVIEPAKDFANKNGNFFFLLPFPHFDFISLWFYVVFVYIEILDTSSHFSFNLNLLCRNKNFDVLTLSASPSGGRAPTDSHISRYDSAVWLNLIGKVTTMMLVLSDPTSQLNSTFYTSDPIKKITNEFTVTNKIRGTWSTKPKQIKFVPMTQLTINHISFAPNSF